MSSLESGLVVNGVVALCVAVGAGAFRKSFWALLIVDSDAVFSSGRESVDLATFYLSACVAIGFAAMACLLLACALIERLSATSTRPRASSGINGHKSMASKLAVTLWCAVLVLCAMIDCVALRSSHVFAHEVCWCTWE